MPEGLAGPGPHAPRVLLLAAAGTALLLAGTVALWAHYGSAVFYEMIVSGIALCL
jgi:hypothetical protein